MIKKIQLIFDIFIARYSANIFTTNLSLLYDIMFRENYRKIKKINA